jgi:prepilin-type N-terminal cleavage/methylation domain-containing protein
MIPSPHRSREGTTLIELMTVLVILGVIAMATAPALMDSVHARRASEAASEVTRAFWMARVAAMGTGRAHLVRFDASGDGGAGALAVLRAESNRCVAQDWSSDAVERVGSYPSLGTSPLLAGFRVEVRGPSDKLDVCYEPVGFPKWRSDTASRFASTTPGALGNAQGGWLFRIIRRNNGASEGVPRHVLVPFGGTARISR